MFSKGRGRHCSYNFDTRRWYHSDPRVPRSEGWCHLHQHIWFTWWALHSSRMYSTEAGRFGFRTVRRSMVFAQFFVSGTWWSYLLFFQYLPIRRWTRDPQLLRGGAIFTEGVFNQSSGLLRIQNCKALYGGGLYANHEVHQSDPASAKFEAGLHLAWCLSNLEVRCYIHFILYIHTISYLCSSFFQVTLWYPKWRSLNPWKGHLKHPKRSLGRTWLIILYIINWLYCATNLGSRHA